MDEKDLTDQGRGGSINQLDPARVATLIIGRARIHVLSKQSRFCIGYTLGESRDLYFFRTADAYRFYVAWNK